MRNIFLWKHPWCWFHKNTSCIYGNLLYTFRNSYSPALRWRTSPLEVAMTDHPHFLCDQRKAFFNDQSLITYLSRSLVYGEMYHLSPETAADKTTYRSSQYLYSDTTARLKNVNGINHHFNLSLLQWTGYCCVVSCQSTVQLCIVTPQLLTSLL